MKTIRNGRHIDTYISRELRQMFYRNPSPSAKYAGRNGYDPYGFSTDGLVLYLPLWALKGSKFNSVDAHGHLCTVNGSAPVWTPQGWYFPGTDERITLGDTVGLPTGTADRTVIVWAYPEAATIPLIGWGSTGVWQEFTLHSSEVVGTGWNVDRYGEAIKSTTLSVQDAWIMVSVSTDGTNVNFLFNGVGLKQVAVAASLLTGVANGCEIGKRPAVAVYWKGIIGEAWIYNRFVPTTEVLHHHNATKFRYT